MNEKEYVPVLCKKIGEACLVKEAEQKILKALVGPAVLVVRGDGVFVVKKGRAHAIEVSKAAAGHLECAGFITFMDGKVRVGVSAESEDHKWFKPEMAEKLETPEVPQDQIDVLEAIGAGAIVAELGDQSGCEAYFPTGDVQVVSRKAVNDLQAQKKLERHRYDGKELKFTYWGDKNADVDAILAAAQKAREESSKG